MTSVITSDHAITVSTGDKTSAVDAVTSLTASLAAMSTTTTTASEQPNNIMNNCKIDNGLKRASTSYTPRYALPTAASIRRREETLRQITKSVSLPIRRTPWEPTRPQSPNFGIAGGRRRRRPSTAIRRASVDPSAAKSQQRTSLQKQKRSSDPTNGSGLSRQYIATVPKSPHFRSRGPTRALDDKRNRPPRSSTFIPTPLPSYLIERDVLPDIKLNAKTVAAMEYRANPQPKQRYQPNPSSVSQEPFSPTVPEPFDLKGLDKHAQHMVQIEMRKRQEEEGDKERRNFHAKKLNEAILDGPTFVPSRSDVPLTQPLDLLPFAEERSQRTKAYEQVQKERMEQAKIDKAAADRMRAEAEAETIRKEYEEKKFKPRAIPKTTYEPHMKPKIRSPTTSTTNSASTSGSRASVGTNVNKNVEIKKEQKPESVTSHMHVAVSNKKDGGNMTLSMNGSSSVDAQVSGYDGKENGHNNVVVCDTSEPQTPASEVIVEHNRRISMKSEDVIVKTAVSSMTTTTSETSQSQDSETRTGRLLQKVKESLSPLFSS